MNVNRTLLASCRAWPQLAGLRGGLAHADIGGRRDLGVAPIYRPTVPVANWTGSYIGISGGGVWGSSVVHNDIHRRRSDPAVRSARRHCRDHHGFNIQNGRSFTATRATRRSPASAGSAFDFPPNGAFSSEVREPWLSTYRGRLGSRRTIGCSTPLAAPRSPTRDQHSGPPGQISEKHWHWGWTLGGGVEMRLTQDWTAKVEYLYVGLQDKSLFQSCAKCRLSQQSAREPGRPHRSRRRELQAPLEDPGQLLEALRRAPCADYAPRIRRGPRVRGLLGRIRRFAVIRRRGPPSARSIQTGT